MAFIVESLAGDRRLQLGGEEFVRPMSFGARWGRLRIGLRCMVNAVSTFTNGGFVVGVCSGATNTFVSSTTTDYIGMVMGSTGGYTQWSYVASSPNYIGAPTVAGALTKVNAIQTVTNGIGSNQMNLSAQATFHSLVIVDITKGSAGSYAVQTWGPSPTQVLSDYTITHMMAYLEVDNLNQVLTGPGASTVPYVGPGFFDCVSVWWLRASPTIEISDIVVLRLY